MLTRSELPENPVVLQVASSDGGRHLVTTERERGGKIRMTCTCAASTAEGWCQHRLKLLCMRYDEVEQRDEEAEFQFEDIVMGTPLADVADEVDMALADFERAVKALDGSRASLRLDGTALESTAALAEDLADASRQLSRALARFRRRLAGGAG